MESKRNIIRSKALELLENNPDGIRYSNLVRMISEKFPTIPINTIHGSVWDIDRQFPDKVYKPAKGLFRHLKFKDVEIKEDKATENQILKEDLFYESFAYWLENETEEATKAIPLGGKKFKDKWGTPDVIGIRKSEPDDIIEIQIEVISAEIKTDSKDLITAFGQACAYKLFSNMVYLVIPKQSEEEDISRLDSLCLIFGIGLVLFDATNHKDPKFQIRVRPLKHTTPDIYYVNKYLKSVKKELFG